MKLLRNVLLACAVIVGWVVGFVISASPFTQSAISPGEREASEAIDNDWFMLQRVYPHDDIDPSL